MEVTLFRGGVCGARSVRKKPAKGSMWTCFWITRMFQQEILTDIGQRHKKEYLFFPKPELGALFRAAFLIPERSRRVPAAFETGSRCSGKYSACQRGLEKTIIISPPRKGAGWRGEEVQWPLAEIGRGFNRSLQLPGLEPGSSVPFITRAGRNLLRRKHDPAGNSCPAGAKAWESAEYPVVVLSVFIRNEPGYLCRSSRGYALKIARMYG